MSASGASAYNGGMRTLLIMLILASAAQAEEIPLKSIWAINAPGTRKLSDLDPGKRVAGKARPRYGPTAREIINTLILDRVPAAEGFAVAGPSRDALKAAHRVLVLERDPPELTSPEKISLVFYSLLAGSDVHFDAVRRLGNKFTIKYHFVVRGVPMGKSQVAIIPVGVLLKGKYEVAIEQLPTQAADVTVTPKTFDSEKAAKDIVCKPFTFEVK